MRCPKCHSENPDTSRFCGNCASPLGSSQEIAVSKTMTVQKPPATMVEGRILAGKYRIIEPIGKGGMGVVYKAEDTELERIVALKFLPAELTEDSEARERFVREAKAAAALSHNHICDIHEIGKEENQLFIVMEYIEGESLKQKISKGALDQTTALDTAIQVAEGLGEAHKRGIVHRDVKPGNIMVTAEGTAKVMDFGLAKALGKSLITKEAKTMGTVAYMSPEQAQGQSVDHRTDIWSLGVVIYEMVTGQLPFKGEYEQSIIHSILNREPEPITNIRKDLPVGLDRVIGKSLEKTPADRYQSMEELLGDLKAIAEGLKPLRAKAGLLRRRILGIKKIYAFAVLAFLVALVTLAIILLVPKGGQAYDSIAVLPLVNQSGSSDQDYFSDGVHTELIMELSRIRSIKVINKTSTMVYKGTNKRTSEIARELGVSALVDGSVRYGGNRIRISVELIDGRTDKNLWAGNFDGENRDALTLQSEAALALAKQIQATLTPEETKILSHRRPVNPEAHEAYLKGMSIIGSLTPGLLKKSDLENSIRCFDQALKIDPNFALAYSGLAWAYGFLALVIPPREAVPKEKDAVLKALSLDDSLAEAHAVLADMSTCYDWDWDVAEREWKRALELNPNYAFAHALYGTFLAGQGRNGEANSHAERAQELDPNTQTTLNYVKITYRWTRQYEKAIEVGRKSLRLFPNNPEIYLVLGLDLLLKGSIKEGIAEYQKAIELGIPPDSPFLSFIYVLSGEKSKAWNVINILEKRAKEEYVNPLYIARTYALLGEKDKAFEWLEKCYEQRHPNMHVIKAEPFYDSLHGDPRFTALLKRLKLEK